MPIFYPQTYSLSPQTAIAYAVRRLHPHGLRLRPRCIWPVRRDHPGLAYNLEQALSYLLTGPDRRKHTVAACRRAGSHYALRRPADPPDLGRRTVTVALCGGHAQGLGDDGDDRALLLLASSR